MTEVSEIASRILAELDEAHAENVTAIMNTVTKVSGDASERAEMLNALRELVGADLAIIGYEDASTGRIVAVSREQSFADIENMHQQIAFSGSERIWKWDESLPWPEILATDAGLVQAERLLRERGYQWWRQDA